MKKFLKKGFTLVELVVCVVVIAVLTGIAVAAYAGVQNRAKTAADDAVITQINTQLALNETENGKNKTCYDAIMDVEEIGFNLEKLVPSTKNCQFVWDQDNDRFAVLDEEMNIISSEQKTSFTKDLTRRWIIASSYFSTEYSVYLTQGNQDTNLTITSGLDVGKNTNVASITYSNTGAAKNLTIRTNGQMSTLNLNGKGGDAGDTINHYGYANQVNVNSVGNKDCYHEWGTASEVIGKAGKIVVESVGNVFEMKKAADAATDSNAPVFENDGGNVLSSEAGTLSEEAIVSTEYAINDYEQLCSFRDATNSGLTFAGITVNLYRDIELKGAWKPISNYYRKTNVDKWFSGVFNGNDHIISGLSNDGLSASQINTGYTSTTPPGVDEFVYGFFGSVNAATIKNVTFKDVKLVYDSTSTLKSDHIASLVGYVKGACTIDGITAYGVIDGFDSVAGIIGGIRDVDTGKAVVSNCKNYVDVSTELRGAGVVCDIQTKPGMVDIISCENHGLVSTTATGVKTTNSVAGIALCAINENNITIDFTDCSCDANKVSGGADSNVALITVVYTTSYNYNSKGNILTTNAGSAGGHTYLADQNGKLVVTTSSDAKFTANWTNK